MIKKGKKRKSIFLSHFGYLLKQQTHTYINKKRKQFKKRKRPFLPNCKINRYIRFLNVNVYFGKTFNRYDMLYTTLLGLKQQELQRERERKKSVFGMNSSIYHKNYIVV